MALEWNFLQIDSLPGVWVLWEWFDALRYQGYTWIGQDGSWMLVWDPFCCISSSWRSDKVFLLFLRILPSLRKIPGKLNETFPIFVGLRHKSAWWELPLQIELGAADP